MKAHVLYGVDDLRFEEASMPVPKEDEALVRVMAAGICGSDIPRIYKTGAHRHPLIPGHEFSGVVEQVGSEKYNRWQKKRVGVFPLIPCHTCESCKKKQYETCKHYGYLGSRQDGGFAEYVAVPIANLIELPEAVTYEEAAMLEPTAVAVHAMRRVSVTRTDCVVVCGLGTIGQLMTMTLQAKGVAELLLVGNKDSQRRFAETINGATFFDIRESGGYDRLIRECGERGVDVFFECVGKNETVNLGIECVAPSGRIMLVGNPVSDMLLEKDVYWQLLRKQLFVTGTWNSSFTGDDDDDWHEVLNLLGMRALQPKEIISHRFPLEDLEKGLRIMRDKTEDFGKIMAVMG